MICSKKLRWVVFATMFGIFIILQHATAMEFQEQEDEEERIIRIQISRCLYAIGLWYESDKSVAQNFKKSFYLGTSEIMKSIYENAKFKMISIDKAIEETKLIDEVKFKRAPITNEDRKNRIVDSIIKKLKTKLASIVDNDAKSAFIINAKAKLASIDETKAREAFIDEVYEITGVTKKAKDKAAFIDIARKELSSSNDEAKEAAIIKKIIYKLNKVVKSLDGSHVFKVFLNEVRNKMSLINNEKANKAVYDEINKIIRKLEETKGKKDKIKNDLDNSITSMTNVGIIYVEAYYTLLAIDIAESILSNTTDLENTDYIVSQIEKAKTHAKNVDDILHVLYTDDFVSKNPSYVQYLEGSVGEVLTEISSSDLNENFESIVLLLDVLKKKVKSMDGIEVQLIEWIFENLQQELNDIAYDDENFYIGDIIAQLKTFDDINEKTQYGIYKLNSIKLALENDEDTKGQLNNNFEWLRVNNENDLIEYYEKSFNDVMNNLVLRNSQLPESQHLEKVFDKNTFCFNTFNGYNISCPATMELFYLPHDKFGQSSKEIIRQKYNIFNYLYFDYSLNKLHESSLFENLEPVNIDPKTKHVIVYDVSFPKQYILDLGQLFVEIYSQSSNALFLDPETYCYKKYDKRTI